METTACGGTRKVSSKEDLGRIWR